MERSIALAMFPNHFDVSAFDRSLGLILASGFIMGFGGRMCNGCTSGHGICGVARLSKRSFAATAAFFGMTLLTVYVSRHVLGLF